jgi:hypothetical protein
MLQLGYQEQTTRADQERAQQRPGLLPQRWVWKKSGSLK